MPNEIRTDPVKRQVDGPFSADQAFPTAIMAVVAILGGLLSFYGKWKAGKVRFFNLTELIGELVVSGLCGIGAYWVFKGFEVNAYLTAAGVAVTGHMGTRVIFMAEQWIEKKLTGTIAAVTRPPTHIAGVPTEERN